MKSCVPSSVKNPVKSPVENSVKKFVKKLILLIFIVGQSAASELLDAEKCFHNGWSKERLIQLKHENFIVEPEQRKQLTQQLRFCLAVKDPEIRDGVAYQAYFSWLRNDKITGAELQALFTKFSSELNAGLPHQQGVYLPFVALVYSEIVRVDRVAPYLSNEQRVQAVRTISKYITEIDDYRGFDEEVGYRHAVAHSADVVLQMALNQSINGKQIENLANAIGVQVNPNSMHFYRYGEPERIARAIGYSMIRDEIKIEFWQDWLQSIASPKPFASWAEVFSSNMGLAKRNNTRQFLTNLYAMIGASEHPRLVELAPVVRELIAKTG